MIQLICQKAKGSKWCQQHLCEELIQQGPAGTHPGAVPGCLIAWQHFPDRQVCCFPQAKTSQANRCLNKYTTTLEYNELVFIKQTTAELQGRPWKVIRTKPPHLPRKQNKAQDLDFPVKSIPWPAMLPQLHGGRPICQATPPTNPNSQAKYSPTKWQLPPP